MAIAPTYTISKIDAIRFIFITYNMIIELIYADINQNIDSISTFVTRQLKVINIRILLNSSKDISIFFHYTYFFYYYINIYIIAHSMK